MNLSFNVFSLDLVDGYVGGEGGGGRRGRLCSINQSVTTIHRLSIPKLLGQYLITLFFIYIYIYIYIRTSKFFAKAECS